MNIEFILDRVNSSLDINGQISKEDFNILFDFLSEQECLEVKSILINHGITISCEKNNSKTMINQNNLSEKFDKSSVNQILHKVSPYLNNNELLEDDFERLFGDLSLKDSYFVSDVLLSKGINIVYEFIDKTEEESIDFLFSEGHTNTKYILNIVKPYLVDSKTLLEKDFNRLFSHLSLTQLYQISDILLENDIYIEYEDEEEDLKCTDSRGISNRACSIKEYYVSSIEYEHPVEITHGNLSDLKELNNEQLCLLYQRGNSLALHLLVKNNQRLVYQRVMKYAKIYNHKLDFDDLFGYGMEGLVLAAQRFEFNKDAKFSTYAIWWVDQKIRRSIMDYGFTVRFPVHRFDDLNKILKVQKQFSCANEYELIEKVMEELQYSEEKIKELLKMKEWCLSATSLNTFIGEDHNTELIEMLEDNSMMNIETEVYGKMLAKELDDILETLTDREERVIRLRFGLEDGKTRTLEEVGKEFGITRERARQIEGKALRKLRHPSRSRRLKDFMEE